VRLPTNIPIGAGQAKAESIRTRFSTVEEVTQELVETMGYTQLITPRFPCPYLTADMLTTQDWTQYSNTYAMFKAWWDFYREKLAEVSNMVLQYKNMLVMVDTATKKTLREMAEATQERLSIDKLKERVLENPEYQEVLLELQRYQQAKELVEAKFDSLDKSMAMISRQIEIRKLDLEQNQINSNIPNRGHQVPRGF